MFLAISPFGPLRFAEDDTLELMAQHLPSNHPVHVHCFTSSKRMAMALLERFDRLRLGFTGVVSFKNAPEVQEVVRHVPLARLLLETDAPYMAPEPFRGRIAHPGHATLGREPNAKTKTCRLSVYSIVSLVIIVTMYISHLQTLYIDNYFVS